MSQRLPVQDKKFANVLTVYAQMLQAEISLMEVFHRDLHNLLQQVDSKDKLLIIGDFNARVGRNFELCSGVAGRQGIGNCYDDGRLLLEFCYEYQIFFTNTLLRQ